jgi:potassium channel subfamily K, other eukaryote
MNDPGLDEPAQQAAQDVEKATGEQEQEQAEWEEQDFLDPR